MKISVLRAGNILLTSLQDGLTDRDLLDMQADLLEAIGEMEASGVVMDVSALEAVDSYTVRILGETVRMAEILGCAVVVSGIRPAVAMTLVQMEKEQRDFTTALDLENGMMLVKRMLGEDDERPQEPREDEREEFVEAVDFEPVDEERA